MSTEVIKGNVFCGSENIFFKCFMLQEYDVSIFKWFGEIMCIFIRTYSQPAVSSGSISSDSTNSRSKIFRKTFFFPERLKKQNLHLPYSSNSLHKIYTCLQPGTSRHYCMRYQKSSRGDFKYTRGCRQGPCKSYAILYI